MATNTKSNKKWALIVAATLGVCAILVGFIGSQMVQRTKDSVATLVAAVQEETQKALEPGRALTPKEEEHRIKQDGPRMEIIASHPVLINDKQDEVFILFSQEDYPNVGDVSTVRAGSLEGVGVTTGDLEIGEAYACENGDSSRLWVEVYLDGSTHDEPAYISSCELK